MWPHEKKSKGVRSRERGASFNPASWERLVEVIRESAVGHRPVETLVI